MLSNYFVTKFVLQIFTFQGDEMFSLITKNNTLVFVSKHIRTFFIPLTLNDIVIYEDPNLRYNFILNFLEIYFF
ncbi:hypothetical protein BDCR2A_00042 [Borrelia duttonii CR2A]|uniref:Uncharacterized protein n=1 Tax=Borrelia duttonii CR2A TaxID=1432657 RepID=W6TLC4_9SPIR|nr:hypothetical protein BDCR2A_00042 [Borrelia duttonii CR2A]